MNARIFFYIVFLFLLITPHGALKAATAGEMKAEADSAYLTEQYDKAIALYNEVLKEGQSSRVCYNLGNCYYRKGQWAKAILWYERTLLLRPGDSDAADNLAMARANTVDQIDDEDQFFLVSVYQRLVSLTSVDGWARWAIAAFVVCLVSFLVYAFAPSYRVRRSAFYFSLAMLLFTALSNVFAFSLNSRLKASRGAIIMVPSVQVANTPTEGAKSHFVLHSGTRVDITDTSIKGWAAVRTPDGREGWVQSENVAMISL